MGVGVFMRWFLAGKLAISLDLDAVRHAHSHLGYFGVLFPLAWLAWRQVGAPVPGVRILYLYVFATVLAFFGFLRAGYGPEGIVGSTLVGVVWVITAWRLRGRLRDIFDPLALVFPGVLFAQLCVPPIAFYIRPNPDLAYAFVATFLAMLLLGVIVPSALASRGVRLPWPIMLPAAVLGAASLGIWSTPAASIGLAVYGVLLVVAAVRGDFALHLRFAWLAVALGLMAMATGLLPNTRHVVIGAIHFLVLSPVLGTLSANWLRDSPPAWAWWISHALVVLLAGPLVALGLGAGPYTLVLSAIGGSLLLCWWLVVSLACLRPLSLCLLLALLGACAPGNDVVAEAPLLLHPRPAEVHCGFGSDGEAPELLSETGCFTDMQSREHTADMAPFLVLSPLWSDGAHKERYLVLPPGEHIEFMSTGEWGWPMGSLLLKNFIVEHERGEPRSRRAVETRIMEFVGATWRMYSYQWRSDGSDALLLDAELSTEFVIEDGGVESVLRYSYPSAEACQYCHDDKSLGPRTEQMNRQVIYVDGERNQLEALAEFDYFGDSFGDDPAQLPALAEPTGDEALDLRTRSYLQGNCAHCHRPGGWQSPDMPMDLRYTTQLADAQICGVFTQFEILGGTGDFRLDPGDPENSALWRRMVRETNGRMPARTYLPDPIGSDLIHDWISALRECP